MVTLRLRLLWDRVESSPAAQQQSSPEQSQGQQQAPQGLAQGVRHYTAESVSQFYLVERCAEEFGKQVEILLRVTSGNQFGMSEEDVLGLIRTRENYPHVEIRGLQYFTGTQKKVIKKIAAEVAYIE